MTRRSAPAVVIDVGDDYITCPGKCRIQVHTGRTCLCPARTKGPEIEALLPKLLTGEVKVTGPKVGKIPPTRKPVG